MLELSWKEAFKKYHTLKRELHFTDKELALMYMKNDMEGGFWDGDWVEEQLEELRDEIEEE